MMSKLENRWQRVPFYIVLHSRTTPKGEQISCLTTAASATTTTNDTVIIDIMLALAGHDSKQHALKTKQKQNKKKPHKDMVIVKPTNNYILPMLDH